VQRSYFVPSSTPKSGQFPFLRAGKVLFGDGNFQHCEQITPGGCKGFAPEDLPEIRGKRDGVDLFQRATQRVPLLFGQPNILANMTVNEGV
jgi:hypothetical protein